MQFILQSLGVLASFVTELALCFVSEKIDTSDIAAKKSIEEGRINNGFAVKDN
jgi:hypothetical protein